MLGTVYKTFFITMFFIFEKMVLKTVPVPLYIIYQILHV